MTKAISLFNKGEENIYEPTEFKELIEKADIALYMKLKKEEGTELSLPSKPYD